MDKRPGRLQPSQIKNKQKRSEVTAKLRLEKIKEKKQRVKRRRQEEERAINLGEEVGDRPENILIVMVEWEWP